MRDYNGYLLYFELPVSFEEISKTKIRNKKYVLEKNSSSSYIDEALKVWNKLSAKKKWFRTTIDKFSTTKLPKNVSYETIPDLTYHMSACLSPRIKREQIKEQ